MFLRVPLTSGTLPQMSLDASDDVFGQLAGMILGKIRSYFATSDQARRSDVRRQHGADHHGRYEQYRRWRNDLPQHAAAAGGLEIADDGSDLAGRTGTPIFR